MKSVYKLKNRRSNFHKFLNQEGLGIYMIANHLEVTEMTIRNYLDNPMKFKVSQLIELQELLEIQTGDKITIDFLINIIIE